MKVDTELESIFKESEEITKFWSGLGVVYEHIDVPWIPTPRDIVELVINIISVGPGDVVYDLGCGDGRIVIEAAKLKAKGICIELNSELIRMARDQSLRLGLENRIIFINDDMANVVLSNATVVYMYLTTKAIEKIKNKLISELRPGTIVVSLDYEVQGLEPLSIVEVDIGGKHHKIFIYLF